MRKQESLIQAFLKGSARMLWGLFLTSLGAMLILLAVPEVQAYTAIHRLAAAAFLVTYAAVLLVMLARLLVDDEIRASWRRWRAGKRR